MKGTYWYAVDYAGTGHLFTYKPERDAGIWNGEEALQVSQGALRYVIFLFHYSVLLSVRKSGRLNVPFSGSSHFPPACRALDFLQKLVEVIA